MSFALSGGRRAQRAVRCATCTVALLLVPTLVLGAQRIVPTLDVGGSRVRYAEGTTSSALAVSPALRAEWDRATLAGGGSYSQLATGWSTQGTLGGSFYAPIAGAFTAELAASLGGSAHADGTRTGQGVALARAHLMTTSHGVWLGAGVGQYSDGVDWHPVRTGEAAGWVRMGTATLLASLTPTQVGDTIRYADAEVAGRWEMPRGELGFSGGVRSGSRLPTLGGASNAWGSASGAAWLAPRMAIVLSGGTYPVDFTQGFPGGGFVSVALRFGPRASARFDGEQSSRRMEESRSPADELTRAGGERAEAQDGVLAFTASPASSGRVVMRVHAPRATTVDVIGDFTDWEPVKLTSMAAGWWSTTLAIRSGSHQMNVRVNEGPWLVPPGLLSVRDEFGGSIGVLVLP
jgi:hypothetical protein